MFTRLAPRVVCRRRRRRAPPRLDGQAATLPPNAAGAVSVQALLSSVSSAASCPSDGQLRDPAVLVEGLGSLSLSPSPPGPMLTVAAAPAASGLLPPSFGLDSSEASSCEDDVEELALRSPLAAANGPDACPGWVSDDVDKDGVGVAAVLSPQLRHAALGVGGAGLPPVALVRAPPAASWFGAPAVAGDEVDEDEEELAPQTPRYAAVDAGAGRGALSRTAASWPPSWASAADIDDEDGDEVLVPQTPPASKTCNADADGKEMPFVAGSRDGWQEVLPRRSPRHPALSIKPVARRPVPAWLKGRCCRCLARGHRAAGCCDPFRCSRCLENGHWARECHNAWRPLSVLDGPAASAPRQALAPCRAQVEASLPSNVPPPSNVPLRRSWASVVSGPIGSLAPADLQPVLEKHADFLQEAIRPLHEVVDSLHGWLLALGGFLERAEAALARLSLAPTDPLVLPDAGKVGASRVGLHGCFSPRARVTSAVSAPVMQIMPGLLESCGDVVMPPSVKEARSDSHEISTLASPPCEALGFERSGVVDVAVSLSPESSRHVVPIGDGVAKSGLLTAVPGAVVAREVCGFLANLAAAYPGSAID